MHHLGDGSGHRHSSSSWHPSSLVVVIGWLFGDVWGSSAVVMWCTQVLLVMSLVVGVISSYDVASEVAVVTWDRQLSMVVMWHLVVISGS